MNQRSLIRAALFSAAMVMSAKAHAKAPVAATTTPSVEACLTTQVTQATKSGKVGGVVLLAPAAVQASYSGPTREPRWVIGDSERPETMLQAIRGADRQGYRSERYHISDIETRLRAQTPCDLAIADVLLTDGFVALAAHLWAGRVDPATVDSRWHARRERFDAQATLSAIATATPASVLDRLAPQGDKYEALVDLHETLRVIVDAGGWPTIDPGGDIASGAVSPRVEQLARRLTASGDLSEDPRARPEHFDAEVEAAVVRFQNRHGLPESGSADTATLEALAISAEARLSTVRVNLERWRWLPEDLGRRHIRINIADFRLEAYEDGALRDAMEVIVGRTYRQTPVFSATIDKVVFNPTWNVPPGIASKDMIPAARKDPHALTRKGIQVLEGKGDRARIVDVTSIEWSTATTATVSFRQPPGPNNALGVVKLSLPNPYNVYLHDTPNKDLFADTRRDFSSGCVRLSRPMDLVAWVLEGQAQGSPDAMRLLVQAGRERLVAVEQPVRVHLQYTTVWVDDAGIVQWRTDIYSRDQRVMDALNLAPVAVPAP